MALKTALRSYAAARGLVTKELEPLMSQEIRAIQESIGEAFDVSLDGSKKKSKRRTRWDSKDVGAWIAVLNEHVTRFEERVEILLRASDNIDVAIEALKSVSYEKQVFNDAVENVQKIVDELSMAGYSDLSLWVDKVNSRVGVVLGSRLQEALCMWSEAYDLSTSSNSKTRRKGGILVKIPKISVEILLRNQEISAQPSVPATRSLFLDELHTYMGIVCTLPRLNSGRFDVFESGKEGAKKVSTFYDLVNSVSSAVMSDAYSAVEHHMRDLSTFVNQWLGYQTLWDSQVGDVASAVDGDLGKWHDLIVEASAARSTLDSTATVTEFGPISVRYSKVQSQVNLKYDSWQKELQTYFAAVLSERINESYEKVSCAKARLEGISLEGASVATNEIVLGVTFLQEVTQQLPLWRRKSKELFESEKLLKRQRHVFRGDWTEASIVMGQLQQVEQVLSKRTRTMEEQVPLLRSRIVAEDKTNAQRLSELINDWEENKPLIGNITPDQAIDRLAKFEFNMKKAKIDHENLTKAKDALCLTAGVVSSDISDCLDEIRDLAEVWEAVSKPYTALLDLKDSLWATAVMRKIRKALDDLMIDLRSLPNRIRQYNAYNTLYNEIKSLLAGHATLSDLKTDSLKERHWKSILQKLNVHVSFSVLTIGMLWDNGLLDKKKDVAEVLSVAQGEMAIEIFLNQVRDKWMKEELDLVLYQNRVRLIRGWDDLFNSLDDHTGGLVLMKSSPYYRAVREFQEDGNLWEDRLTKLRTAFDAWIDVQRRWVYLEGIFFGSADIKAQLPAEWSRFKSVDGEFITLMRRISSRPYAMEALNIDNLQRTLERLQNLMVVIQKALGAYLEKQRNDFSRFYFLGDDDLLEIIGNASEPGKVLPHLGKMFASIATLNSVPCEDEGVLAKFDAMLSKDGEKVTLHSPIVVTDKMNVKEWLKQLEDDMKMTLAKLLHSAVSDVQSAQTSTTSPEGKTDFVNWANKFPAQVMILASQVDWSMSMDAALRGDSSEKDLETVLSAINGKLEVMAETVLLDLPSESRKKFEQLITELVHKRDVTKSMIDGAVCDVNDFRWLYHMRFDYNPDAEVLTEKLCISLSNASFYYGFEYLGIGERLVQTPLTDRCYLTLTQALNFRMGGNPFGPAGTGKTESVKALGAQLGRFVVVMNCDETFDFGAMGRIFCGLCQVGAWGCFDEFNRLEERILSAVSQQILTIQQGSLERQKYIELLGKTIALHENVGIFVTMNPGYAGRSNLPDNLKTLFRSVAMVVPDRNLIAQVMLYSQGIVSAESLSSRVVDLFIMSQQKMSKQTHYDFGLRALKTLLVSAGGLKRKAMMGSNKLEGDELANLERKVLIQGACNNILPKLIAGDLDVFTSILEEVFPGSEITKMENEELRGKIDAICKTSSYIPADQWVQKILQLKMVIEMRHGIMIVGPSGSGKSSALRTLMKGLEEEDGVKGEMYMIDPKAIDKESLYGVLDGTTLEWTDGVFTSLLRAIIANQRGEADRRYWIVFDGDVDPEWAENLNSVLDDNKLLTLPSGERLSIPDNVRIILEVDSLEQATPATVSRCGMVWFSAETVTNDMCLRHFVGELRSENLSGDNSLISGDGIPSAQISFLGAVQAYFISEDSRSTPLVADALEFGLSETHIMDISREGLLRSLKSLLIKGIVLAIEYDENHPDFPMTGQHMDNFAKRWVLHSSLWSFAGSASWDVRNKLADLLLRTSGMMLPSDNENGSLADYRVRVENGELELWSDSVPRMEIESHKVTATDVVVTTTDTVRHSDILGAWLESRSPLILCGPPGSGKTMTLTSVLQSVQGVTLASLNFSSRTTPEIIMKTFSQYCTYVRKGKDVVLEPVESLGTSNWLVVFCDEINLPEEDSYGTQRVIMFMRQLVEQGGFWREDNVWVKTNRIQFVGACNPPTDAGRVELSSRFLRHASLLLVDFPSRDSLTQIYRTFNGGIMKLFPQLKGETDVITEAMIELFTACQKKFTPQMQPQYFYSPRELSRWVRGIYEAVVHMDHGLTREELIRIWAHEALRLFSDRLVEHDEIEWCSNKIDEVARQHFAAVDHDEVLARPLFYSSWLTKDTRRVNREELKTFLSARLKVFYEEELDVPLVVFDQVLDHVLRIDRVLRQPMGHCLLVGDSGAGKTVLSKFVSWMNGLQIFQIKAHSRYGIDDFNEDLRGVMRRVGVDGEKICFIFDEGNVLGSGFLEAMNALLASGEVPGLFDGDEYTSLMSACRDSAARDGVIVDSEEELWRRFTAVVQRNLHVVFTMNPSGGEWKNRSTTSPALFNRCVVDWFGSWSAKAMAEVGREFTTRLDMGDAEAVGGSWGISAGENLMSRVEDAFDGVAKGGFHQAVVAALVQLHTITKELSEEAATSASSLSRTVLSPRDYLALINNFVTCVNHRREEIEDEQLHVNAGLSKLKQTQENVAELKVGLASKTVELREKEILANNKLQQMVADQNEAQKRKDEAEKMSFEVDKQQVAIAERKEKAQNELEEAEPALTSARDSVKGIKKRDLDEVRNLARPPVNVKLTLECVAIMLGEKKTDWTDVKKLLAKKDFIPSILDFDVDNLTSRQIQIVREKYLDGNADLSVEKVMRSSKACGPLYQWAESQIKFSIIYNSIQPLREEVEKLEQDAKVANDEKERLESEVAGLESSIANYKSEYATLIRDVEALKHEMEVVTTKVERAESLMKSLSQESERWSKSSEGFQSILSNLVGDGLQMAAFLTYAGFFPFSARRILLQQWRSALDDLGIEFREDLSMIESLSKASDRLEWQSQGLPSDSLSLENGVIISRCVRFPLIIDPSGHAIAFMMNKYKDQKIQKTSFLDKSFMKVLSGAVRFGTTLLVENVEKLDPVLNPILNKEIQRTGGRSLVRIGTEDVDFSPKFNIILTTKNPGVRLTPDICSRVTLVNFTVTPAGLQSQSLTRILKNESPEVESQRNDILRLQGEQNVKLRGLEEQMLREISAVEGSILDDDRVVEGMERLMKEGVEVEEQMAKSAEVMTEVQRAISKFAPISLSCKELFVLFAAMREISFLYEFTATSFMSVLDCVLKRKEHHDVDDRDSRLALLKTSLYREVASRIGRGLKEEDKMVFALLLAKLSTDKCALDEKKEDLSTDDITSMIEDAFGSNFPWQGKGLNNLKDVTFNDISSMVPLLLCSAPGHDVSGRVEAMAKAESKELAGVAMGSTEGYQIAEKFIASASKRGTWVMLKNCHLCTDWLDETLVKTLQSLHGTHRDFRIFITSEISPKLPTALLQQCDIIVAEAPTGIKASLSRFFSRISSDRFTNSAQNRLYLILGWTHAVIQERLRFRPSGWSQQYEFTEADAIHALDVIDSLVSDTCGKKQNVDPEKLPWEAIRTTLCKGVFGGRVTDDSDQDILDCLVERTFVPNAFNVDFKLVDVDGAPTLPEGSSKDECFAWIDSLPSHNPPTWIGLDSAAETERDRMVAESVAKKYDDVTAALSDE